METVHHFSSQIVFSTTATAKLAIRHTNAIGTLGTETGLDKLQLGDDVVKGVLLKIVAGTTRSVVYKRTVKRIMKDGPIAFATLVSMSIPTMTTNAHLLGHRKLASIS